MGAGGTGRDRRKVRSLGAVLHRDMPWSKVDDQHRDEERRDFLVAALVKSIMIPFDAGKAAQTGSYQNPYPLGIALVNHQPGVFHGKMSGSQGILDKEVHLLDLFFVDELFRIEVLDLTGNFYRKISCIKTGDMSDAGFAGDSILPVLAVTDSQRRNGADPGNYDSSHNTLLLKEQRKQVRTISAQPPPCIRKYV